MYNYDLGVYLSLREGYMSDFWEEHSWRIMPLIFIGLLLLCMLSVIGDIVDHSTFEQRAPTATAKGTITRIDVSHDSCNAHVQFRTVQGQLIEFKHEVGSSRVEVNDQPVWISCDKQVGDTLDVVYHLDNPQSALVLPPGGFQALIWQDLFTLVFILPVFIGLIKALKED
jgi:hypothetical protein